MFGWPGTGSRPAGARENRAGRHLPVGRGVVTSLLDLLSCVDAGAGGEGLQNARHRAQVSPNEGPTV